MVCVDTFIEPNIEAYIGVEPVQVGHRCRNLKGVGGGVRGVQGSDGRGSV